VTFPDDLLAQADDPQVARSMAGEVNLFHLRAETRQGQKAQLTERIGQLGQQIDGLTRQVDAKASELKIIAGELEGVQKLYKKNLVTQERVDQLAREQARLEGERGQLIAAIAEAMGKISETKLQIWRRVNFMSAPQVTARARAKPQAAVSSRQPIRLSTG